MRGLKGGSLDRAASRGIVGGEVSGRHGIVLRGRKIGTSIRIVLLGEALFTEASQVNWGRKGHQPKGGKQVRLRHSQLGNA